MKIILACLMAFLAVVALAFINPGRPAHAGVIPYSLVENEEQPSKKKTCKELRRHYADIVKKMAELKREQERYQAELNKLGENGCGEAKQ